MQDDCARSIFRMSVRAGQRRAVHVERVAIGDDIPRIAVKLGEVTVSGEDPGAVAVQSYGYSAGLGGDRPAGGVDDAAVNAAGKAAPFGQTQRQPGVAAHLDRAGQDLRDGVQSGGVAAAAPAVRTDGEQDVVAILIDDADVLQRDDRIGVGDMEDVAVLAGQTSVVLHCKIHMRLVD